jgi:response regulator RpfG family c-di-GMP phosphodiesterase
LARECAVPEEDLIHIHRGAVLHDIGKIAVPDAVLSKPDVLTAAEWEIMRRHPDYAREMLSPIRYLKPALDIPYSHHERWDGSGYPLGLRGEEIPLSARVFAVADVWDSLTNNRPYRAAWSEEQVVGYMRDNAGILFDPSVVGIFLQSEPWRRAEPLAG